jgi:hypothetical protein
MAPSRCSMASIRTTGVIGLSVGQSVPAVEKAQEAVARITSKVAAATTETQSMR